MPHLPGMNAEVSRTFMMKKFALMLLALSPLCMYEVSFACEFKSDCQALRVCCKKECKGKQPRCYAICAGECAGKK